MVNDIRIEGDTAVLVLSNRSNQKVESLIDSSDLPAIQKTGLTWYPWWNKKNRRYYVCAKTSRSKGRVAKQIFLHRFLMVTAETKLVVDHINRDSLDNRRCNLRLVTQSVNSINRPGTSRHNPSRGLLGVTWHKGRKRWQAQAFFKGHHYYLGLFADKQQAACAVQQKLESLKQGETDL